MGNEEVFTVYCAVCEDNSMVTIDTDAKNKTLIEITKIPKIYLATICYEVYDT